jgi:hypothetical protein
MEPNIVGTKELVIAGLSCGQFGTIRLKFHCQLHFREPLDAEMVEWSHQLAADKELGY